MNETAIAIDNFTRINDQYAITKCNNGFLVEVSGELAEEGWVSRKYVILELEELLEVVTTLAKMKVG